MIITLQRVIKKHVLPRELEQHRIVEEFVDGHILRQSFPPSGL